MQINLWQSGVVVITTAQPHSTMFEHRFWAGWNPARGVSDIRNGEDLWQWSRLEIRLNAFRRSTIPQKQFIIIITIIIIIIIEFIEISTYRRSLSRTNKTILFILSHVYFYPDNFVSQSICVRFYIFTKFIALKNRLIGLNPNNVKIVLVDFRVQLYKQNVGGNLGKLVFLWKVPQNINQSQQHKTVILVRDMVPQYECRATARELREQFSKIRGVTPVVRRQFVKFLTGKISQYLLIDFIL